MAKVETTTCFKDQLQKLHSIISVLFFFFFFQNRPQGHAKFKERGNISHSLIREQQGYIARICGIGDTVDNP